MPRWLRLLPVLVALLAPAAVPAVASAAGFMVDSTGDLPDKSPGDGQCKDTTDPPVNAKCTLRAALMETNALAGPDSIGFALGAGLATIQPLSQLPEILGTVDINGTSQPGWNGLPIIQLSGALAPADTDGLRITNGVGSSVRGLIINGFRIGLGIDGPGGNTVVNDWIGTDATGFAASPNRRSGIYVFSSPNNVIGGPSQFERNVVSGNGVPGVGVADEWGKGIEIFGAGSVGNKVVGNYVGTDLGGSTPLGNLRHGIWIGSGVGNLGTASNTDVGDGTAEGRNVVAANGEEGIYVLDSPGTRIRGNIVGLGLDGRAAGNGFRGIAIENAPGAQIGGLTAGERNVVSANGFSPNATEEFEGIVVFGPEAKNVMIQGNYVGTNLAGDAITDAGGASTGNKGAGISLTTRTDLGGAKNGLVGGTTAAHRNVIGGNDVGVAMINRATANRVEGNYIGADKTGAVALPNNVAGVLVYAADENTVGGTAAGTRNIISGNSHDGIRIQWDEPTALPALRNKVQGNYIGLAQDGTTALPNRDNGVTLLGTASENVIGYDKSATAAQLAGAKACDSGECNRIVGNGSVGGGGVGVWVRSDTGVKNTIRGNRLADNRFLGIDLGTGNPTPNDVDDADTGANGLLNFPVAVSSYQDPETSQKRISGRIVGPNPDKVTVDIYSSDVADPIGFGEGRTWEASVTPSKTGSFTYDYAAATGMFFSATATDQDGNTSEFSSVCDDPDGDGSTDGDADGLCDRWETSGIDYDGDRTADLALGTAPFGADPTKKDAFVEVDYMDALFHTHKPEPGALTDVVAAFASAPVDGGQGVALHVTPGDADGADDDVKDVELLKTTTRGPADDDDFVDLRDGDPADPCDGKFGTAADRGSGSDTCWKILGAKALAFRYAIFGHTFEECPDCSGVADEGGDNFLVSLGPWSDTDLQRDGGGLGVCLNTANCKRQVEAGTFMHELGHTFQLGHAGRIGVDDEMNFKPNYLSVMNYTFQFRRTVPARPLDYSRWNLPALNEAALLEGKGIDNDAPPAGLSTWGNTSFTHYDAGTDTCVFANVPAVGDIDWNWSGPIDAAAVSTGINHPDRQSSVGQEECQKPANFENLKGHDDWSNLHFDQRDITGWNELGAGDVAPNHSPELTDSQQQELAQLSDSDGDGVDNATDNCNTKPNPGQEDADGDGIGDACSGVAPDPPANTMRPAINGYAPPPRDGDTLVADKGAWTGTEPIAYDYLWQACDAAGSNCADLQGGQQLTLAADQIGKRIRLRVTASNAANSGVTEFSDPTAAVVARAPANTALPTITGDARDGVQLTGAAGTWTGTQPIAFAYRWLRCDTADVLSCAAIAGAAAAAIDYTAGTADIGKRLRLRVTATNASGTPVEATSAATLAVAAVALQNTALPVVSGVAQAGLQLMTSQGSWTGSEPRAFTIAWLRCDGQGASCTAIPGATTGAYTLAGDDVGHTIRSRVTAGNPAGVLAVQSLPTAVVVAAPSGGGGGPSGGGGGGGTPAPGGSAADTLAPTLTVTVARTRLKPLARKGLRATIGCSEACEIVAQLTQPAKKRKKARKTAMLSAGGARAQRARVPSSRGVPFLARGAARPARVLVIGRGSGRLTAAGKTTVVVKLTAKGRKALRRARRLSATLTVTARDGAGNAATAKRKISARR